MEEREDEQRQTIEMVKTAPPEISFKTISFITDARHVLAYLGTDLAPLFYESSKEISSPTLMGIHITDLIHFRRLRTLRNVLIVVDEGDIERMRDFPPSWPEGVMSERKRRGRWVERPAIAGYYAGEKFRQNLPNLQNITFIVHKKVAYFIPAFLFGRLFTHDRRQSRTGTYRFLSPVRDGDIDIQASMKEEHFFLLWNDEVLLRSYTSAGTLTTLRPNTEDLFPDTEMVGTPIEKNFYLVLNYNEFEGVLPEIGEFLPGTQLLGGASVEAYNDAYEEAGIDRTENDPLPWPPRGFVNPLALAFLVRAILPSEEGEVSAASGFTFPATMLGPERLPELVGMVARDSRNEEAVEEFLEPLIRTHIMEGRDAGLKEMATTAIERGSPILAFMTESPSLLEGLSARVPSLGPPPGFPSIGEAIDSDNDRIMDLLG